MPQLDLTPSQQAMLKTLEVHDKAELDDRDLDATLATMTDNPYLFAPPTLAGGDGQEGVREFYRGLMKEIPEDFAMAFVSETVGSNRIVREIILSFTHSMAMDWLLPGIAPTGRRVEIPIIIIYGFKGDKLESEHLYWDQASMLLQLGLLEAGGLPITGSENVLELLRLTKSRE